MTLTGINSAALDNPKAFCVQCNADYAAQLDRAASFINESRLRKIILLAGPSSAGKTTTASLLARRIKESGNMAYIVSLDNFYHGVKEAYPLNENGKPDFECLEALDLECMHDCFETLIKEGSCELPVFDFKTASRSEEKQKIFLNENDVVIVEGIHALNPAVARHLPPENLVKLYVSVSSRVYGEEGNVILAKRELRFIRRMVRDFHHRASSVDKTFELWFDVLKGEDKYIFPFKEFADIKLNSFYACEPCVLAGEALRLLATVDENSQYKKLCGELAAKLEKFVKLDYSMLTPDSLLWEFVG